jgi:carboxyl-terminal processing protease
MRIALLGFLLLLPFLSAQTTPAPVVPDPAMQEALDAIAKNLVTAPDTEQWKQARQRLLTTTFATSEERNVALRGLLQLVPDPNTRLLSPAGFTLLQQELQREIPTTGITDLCVHRDGHHLTLVTPIAGSSADRAGLRPGDVIEAVDGTPVPGIERETVLNLLRGAEGSKVTVGIQRGGRHLKFELARAINHDPPALGEIRQVGGVKFAYVVLTEFPGNAGAATRELLRSLLEQGARAVLLDLRNNPGGLLTAAQEVAGLFLPEGPLAMIRRRSGETSKMDVAGPQLTTLSLTVLVNEGTASAAEVVAAALQDRKRATVIGAHTVGQGLAFAAPRLSDDAILLLASGLLITPAGRALQGSGVTPDLPIASPVQLALPLLRNAANDEQYANAVKVLLAGAKASAP